ncbi:hypothetical protein CVT25_013989 [Psilocybe cyanescens]|uniref:Uncharacterized protein n=1 Tax=Psilocybe cyanescens TaxID=93625 RepID=A0A409XPH8_PSICY|nr:hypothetical protein CVT25_013989 [Psilocybe cyanescens]
MPLRALRLLPFPTTSEATFATSLSFTSTLQLAAGRAWSRRVVANASTSHVHKRGVGTRVRTPVASNEWKKSTQPGPSDSKCREYGAIPIAPITKVEDDMHRVERTEGKAPHNLTYGSHTKLNRPSVDMITLEMHDDAHSHLHEILPNPEQESLSHKIPSKIPPQVHSVTTELPRPARSAAPPIPQSTASLHQNLLYLINIRRPILSLPALLDYHAIYPDLQSISSYNLLIALSLRHRFLGTTQQLLRRLEMAKIPKNTETYKLEVRWYIAKELWNNAWNYVQQLILAKKLPEAIPYSIWLEFCRTPKARRIRRQEYDEDGQPLRSYFECVDNNLEDWKRRQKLLSDHRPAHVPTLANTKPFAVYCLTQLLIRTGNRERALNLTEAYFQSMPRCMDTKNALRCLATIHAHMVSCTAKDGLPKFFETRRTLISLLKLHPLLRPNSRTLYLLLGPLRRAKKCGTVAWKTLRTFRSQWGTQVEDKQVRRRVSQLALKEGRMDLVTKMMESEASDRRYRQRRLHEEYMTDGLERVHPGWHARFPSRDLYPKNGREARLWLRLTVRTRKIVKKRKRIRPNVKNDDIHDIQDRSAIR